MIKNLNVHVNSIEPHRPHHLELLNCSYPKKEVKFTVTLKVPPRRKRPFVEFRLISGESWEFQELVYRVTSQLRRWRKQKKAKRGWKKKMAEKRLRENPSPPAQSNLGLSLDMAKRKERKNKGKERSREDEKLPSQSSQKKKKKKHKSPSSSPKREPRAQHSSRSPSPRTRPKSPLRRRKKESEGKGHPKGTSFSVPSPPNVISFIHL